MKTTFVSAVCLMTAIAAHATCDKSLDDFPALPGEDDAARIQRAVNALPEGSLYIPKGVYRMSSTLMVTNRCLIELNRGAAIRQNGRTDSRFPPSTSSAGRAIENDTFKPTTTWSATCSATNLWY